MRTNIKLWLIFAVWASSLSGSLSSYGQGIVLPGVGAVNRSMAGATVGAPLDAAGSMHWNPAAIAGLRQSEIMFGAEFLYSRTDVDSSIPGLGGGTTRDDSGIAVLPTSALVYQPPESPWTYGLGIYTIGGFGANYPAAASNPIFSPSPPAGAGVGAVYSELVLVQYAPTAAAWLTDHLAVGLAPTVTMAGLGLDPAFFAAPDDADGSGFASYPAATHSRFHWGLGFQLGLYYETAGPWSFGFSFKSPQWFETFQFNATDEVGNARRLAIDIDYPMILSWGVGFRPSDRLLWALDLRHINYEGTDGFGNAAAFAADGSGTGLGWQSVLSVATGIHYVWNDRTSLRLGYLFNENPIPDSTAFFNIASPPIFQHAIFLGGSRRLTEHIAFSLSYLHAFENSIRGPYQTPLGPIPGGSVGIETATDALNVSLQVNF